MFFNGYVCSKTCFSMYMYVVNRFFNGYVVNRFFNGYVVNKFFNGYVCSKTCVAIE